MAGIATQTRKILASLFLTAGLLLSSGCDIIELAVSDIGGWDISACVGGGFDVCWELFSDNSEKFAGGFASALGSP